MIKDYLSSAIKETKLDLHTYKNIVLYIYKRWELSSSLIPNHLLIYRKEINYDLVLTEPTVVWSYQYVYEHKPTNADSSRLSDNTSLGFVIN